MLRLQLTNSPGWLDLGHGVRVLVEPMGTAMMIAARRDPAIAALGDEIEELNNDDLALVMAKAVARIAIKDWEGVGDADGKPVTVTPQRIDALLEVWPLFEAFQTKYINSGFLLDAEKNVLPLSPDGNSAGAVTIAKPAKAHARTARKP
jgi:hypothetical protein